MENGVLKYLLENYHVLGILLVVTIIAVKLFMTTRRAKKLIASFNNSGKLDGISTRLDQIENSLEELNRNFLNKKT